MGNLKESKNESTLLGKLNIAIIEPENLAIPLPGGVPEGWGGFFEVATPSQHLSNHPYSPKSTFQSQQARTSLKISLLDY